MTTIQDTFLKLVRLGIGASDNIPEIGGADWQKLDALANEHGLIGVILDGVEKLPKEHMPEKKAILKSIGQLIQSEKQYAMQERAAAQMALLLHEHCIKTYVLKGTVVAECYPKPQHRRSVDMDCYLQPEKGTETVWEKGNLIVEEAGFIVDRGFYKNSTLRLPGLIVENHKFMTPCRDSARLKRLERLLQSIIAKDAGVDRFEGTWLYRPPVMVSALFLIEHAYSHFLHEGLTWRLVLDWMMFSHVHREEIDWASFDTFIDEFGFRKFYDSYVRLGRYLIGEIPEGEMNLKDLKMLEDIWAPLDVHESLHGLKAKFQLAGNYWRARWKYNIFTDMTWFRALSEWVLGAVFVREPRIE